MDERLHYTDPRGRRSGPFSLAELRSLAERGLLEPDGTVEDGSGQDPWRVQELFGLAADPPCSTGGEPAPEAGIPSAPHTAARGPELFHVTAVVPPPERLTPPTSPDDPALRPADPPPSSSLSRIAYVLLAILLIPCFAFGVHNLAAGYIGRGIVQLLLGLISLAMVASGGWFAPLCCCFGGPLYGALAVWSILDAITVTRDAHGLRFR